MTRPQRVHYLRQNAGERSPRRVAVLDSEARWSTEGKRELQELRLWAACNVLRRGKGYGEQEVVFGWGRTSDELTAWLSSQTRKDGPLWTFSHNLSYDLALTRLPLHLIADGWELGQHNLGSDSPWAHLSRKTRSLWLVDSWGYLRKSVDDLGKLLGHPKPPLPQPDDPEEVWLERCTHDLLITTEAILRLLDEWDRRRLGWFARTGPATAWNSMLHYAPRRALPPQVNSLSPETQERPGPAYQLTVINPDPGARAFEREAIYSGRRDLWRWGQLPLEHYAELDFRLAHLSILAHCPLPDRRGPRFPSLDMDGSLFLNPLRTTIADCRVRTATPRYPLKLDGYVFHPVGEFWTRLAGPELREARERGDLLEIGAGYTYRLGWHMRPWALWALSLLDDTSGEIEPMLQCFLRMASRTVPSRSAMLISSEHRSGEAADTGWSLEPASFGSPPRRGYILRVAGRYVELVRDTESDDAFPAVLACIQAWDRLLVQRMIDCVGEESVVQVNTDSALVSADRLIALARESSALELLGGQFIGRLGAGALAVSEATNPLTARVKRVGRGGRLLSPQHLDFAGERHYSGIPRTAVEIEPHKFQFWTWPKLAGQMERGDPRGYVREQRTVELREVQIPRWAYADGCAEAPETAVDASGATVLCPPPPDGCRRHGVALRALQHRVLRRVL